MFLNMQYTQNQPAGIPVGWFCMYCNIVVSLFFLALGLF